MNPSYFRLRNIVLLIFTVGIQGSLKNGCHPSFHAHNFKYMTKI